MLKGYPVDCHKKVGGFLFVHSLCGATPLLANFHTCIQTSPASTLPHSQSLSVLQLIACFRFTFLNLGFQSASRPRSQIQNAPVIRVCASKSRRMTFAYLTSSRIPRQIYSQPGKHHSTVSVRNYPPKNCNNGLLRTSSQRHTMNYWTESRKRVALSRGNDIHSPELFRAF